MRISYLGILPAGGSFSKVCRSSILDILASLGMGKIQHCQEVIYYAIFPYLSLFIIAL